MRSDLASLVSVRDVTGWGGIVTNGSVCDVSDRVVTVAGRVLVLPGNDFVDDVTSHVCQAKVTSRILEGQPLMVQAQQVQDRGM